MSRPRGPATILAGAVLFFGLGFLAYRALFHYAMGPYFPAEYWIRDSLVIKEHTLKTNGQPGRTVLILAGSNALYGMDSELLSRRLDRSVVNFAAHLNLGLDYYRHQLASLIDQRLMGRGDVVVMPLELEFYTQTDQITDWSVNNLMAWNSRYLASLDTWQFYRVMFSTTPLKVLAAVAMHRRAGDLRPVPGREASPEQVLAQIESVWATGEQKGFTYLNLTHRGDLVAGKAPPLDFPPNDFGLSAPLQDRFIKTFRALTDLAARHQIRVVLTWPVTMRNSLLDFSQPQGQALAVRLTTWLEQHDIQLKCDPMAFQFPSAVFLDTPYHLSNDLRTERTERLGDCLACVIGQAKDCPAISSMRQDKLY